MSEVQGKTLFPQVQWAQRKHLVILRVLVKPVQTPDFTIRADYMTFKGEAVGMSGKAMFGFELVFYEPVQSDKCRVKFYENEIEFRLLKKQEGVWPRLQASHEKPHWISVDFNHWEYQKEGSEVEEEEEEGGQGGKEVDPEKIKKVAETRAQLDVIEAQMKADMERYNSAIGLLSKMKIIYLLAYNVIQWSSFVLIVVLLLKGLRAGSEGISSAYEVTSQLVMFSHLMMQLEIFHAALGIVKSGVLPTVLQVFGRFLMVFVVLGPAVEIHTHPVVFVLFLAWSLIEVIRYPFYALSVMNMDVKFLTWLRYTAWIPLYPLGFTCEALTIWLSLEHFDNSEDLSYPLPNLLNISLYPPYILRCAVLLVPLIAFNQISFMFAQRKKKLQKLKTL